ncbi:hypothetical protein J4N46_09415 [Capnocytophaga sp. Marseille-Q4570]|uniref:Uncharacterized protein n=1 Tax=Capnocytophaga bilenii TaxID=2819369 RepID=A0ABS3PZH6_9FLAO|nr:hypothetical protein [Capnocytophaga bilenii]MBO1884622.1 hypothetical protein [Capnocytophaga bilenii]
MKKISLKHVMHWLIPLRFEHSQIFKLANLLIFLLTFIGCSKKDNNEPVAPSTPVETPAHLKDWVPQPKVDSTQPYMAFATEATAPTLIGLLAVGNTASATDVWVDTNNNGVFDEGVDKRITDFTKPIAFKPTNKIFVVYGRVTRLNVSDNVLIAADVRKNATLKWLDVSNNQLSEKAMLNLIASLPKTTDPNASIRLRSNDGDANKVTKKVLETVKTTQWAAIKVVDGREVPFTEAHLTDLDKSNYIELTSYLDLGKPIILKIEAEEQHKAEIWVDLNNNGKWDEGIDQYYPADNCLLKTQTFKVYGKVKSFTWTNGKLGAIDISHNTALKELNIFNNNIPYIENIEHLEVLKLDTYTQIITEGAPNLKELHLNETIPVPTITTKYFPNLTKLSVFSCEKLTSLDLKENTKLEHIEVSNTKLTSLDLSNNPQIKWVYVGGTPLTTLKIRKDNKIEKISFESEEGNLLQGEALMNVLRQLPQRPKNNKGKVGLSSLDQVTGEVEALLGGLNWEIE